MERVPEEPVPTDSSDARVESNSPLAARRIAGQSAAEADGGGKPAASGALSHCKVGDSISDSADMQRKRGSSKMRHISFELAVADSLNRALWPGALPAALDPALGKRR